MLGIYLSVCLVIVDTIYPLCIRTGICAHQVDLALMSTQRSHIRNITFMFLLQSDITVFFVDDKMAAQNRGVIHSRSLSWKLGQVVKPEPSHLKANAGSFL